MLLDLITKGSVDRSVTVRIRQSSDGFTPKTDVAYNSAGLALWYRREGGAKADITEATLAALTTAHTDGGFLHISDGDYRLDLPDAAFATGANYVDVGGTVTGGIIDGGRIRLVDAQFEAELATAAGLATLQSTADAILTDTAEIGAAGAGLTAVPWNSAWATQMRSALGLALANLDTQIGTLATAANLATLSAYVDTEVAAILAIAAKLDTMLEADGDDYKFTAAAVAEAPTGGSAPTASQIADAVWDEAMSGHQTAGTAGEALSDAGALGSPATPEEIADEVQTRTIAAVTTVNGVHADVVTDIQAGLATAAALAAIDSLADAIKAKTDNLPSDPSDASVIAAATDAIMARLGSPAGASLAADIANKTGYRLSTTGVNDILRTTLEESYAAVGQRFTLEQALYMIFQILANRRIVNTTLEVQKLNGANTAMSFALDDASDPTSQTRTA